jgi:alpha-beta hydrolase superfamily lysophospholipase
LLRRLWKYARRGLLVVLAALVTFLGVRAWDSQRGPELDIWHTYVPEELDVEALDEADWGAYLAHEERIFLALARDVSQQLEPEDHVPFNRYFNASPIYPGSFEQDWNRSYTLEPAGPPQGAVVLLHGLTDSPYSLRHIAERYQEAGFTVVAIRLPGHGTVPAGLLQVEWPEWMAATRLAVREAVRRAGPDAPLHIVGFSNGGALALKYAMEAIDRNDLRQADQLVLVSPMVGITAFARFAGIAGWPAVFPRWAKAAWIAILPEFNPFKYNSFPVNGARQSHQVTMALQADLRRHQEAGRLGELPPVLTFQSVVDFTVSTAAVVNTLHGALPEGRSELVLFDANRSIKFGPLLRADPESVLNRLLPSAPRPFKTTIIGNVDPDRLEVVARVTEAGSTTETVSEPLGLFYPPDVFSLSHVAVPFPVTDSLYGIRPDPEGAFGVSLGALATRGERGILIVSIDSLLRMASNPFFDYMIERIAQTIPAAGLAAGASASDPG